MTILNHKSSAQLIKNQYRVIMIMYANVKFIIQRYIFGKKTETNLMRNAYSKNSMFTNII